MIIKYSYNSSIPAPFFRFSVFVCRFENLAINKSVCTILFEFIPIKEMVQLFQCANAIIIGEDN